MILGLAAIIWRGGEARALDLSPADGVSDVWADHFGATGLDPSSDIDGDGQNLLIEGAAGTNPFDPLSRFAATVTTDQTELRVEWLGVLGKRYQVEQSYNLLDWAFFAGPVVGAGTNVSVADSLPSAGGGEMIMMSAPDPLGEALAALAAEGLVPRWEPYPSWAPNPPPKPPLGLYLVSACGLDNGLSSMYFCETTKEGLAHYLVLSSIPLGRLLSPQQWLDEKAGYGAIFMTYPYPWETFAWYWDIKDADKLEKKLLSGKEFTWTSEPFGRFGYRAPSGWVFEYLSWLHRYFAENAERFAKEMSAYDDAMAGAGKPDPFELAMAAPEQEGDGGMMTMSLDPDGIRKFYRVQTLSSVDWDGDGLDAYEEGLLGTSDDSTDSDGDGVGDAQEFAANLHPNSSVDSDADEMPDDWENFYFGTLERNGSGDFDGDGIRDLYEFLNCLDPSVANDPFSDPDGDRLTLVQEHAFGTSERSGDTDGDGWSDYCEYFSGTDPHQGDSDNDGSGDFDEDFDGDGLTNRIEVLTHHTDPLTADTDLDELSDHEEVLLGLNPLDHGDGGGDMDGDKLTTTAEIRLGSDYACPDSDDDGIADGVEVDVGLNPLLPDSDGNLVDDGQEDTDDDGLTNAQELTLGTDMGDPDTDDDGINDGADPDPLTP